MVAQLSSAHLRQRRELCNECHTSDNYEFNHGILPGSLVYNWQVQQAAFLKHTIGVQQVRGSFRLLLDPEAGNLTELRTPTLELDGCLSGPVTADGQQRKRGLASVRAV